ncbi:hypothetical protein Nepgr_022938 [Nepenthes gracilis]|uniref:Uncharacterized protein n=1 Tax=Nepenthes gracilis TaxID=150966 RepID=A0AAD3T3G0_NEPGR|nr:hypothetical protein Nepgr_022938 [Nepenthes gracilis]
MESNCRSKLVPGNSHPKPLGSGLTGPVLNESPHPEVHVEPPIDVYGNSGKCLVAEEALPLPESLPTPIAVLNAEPLAGAVIETPALPSDDTRALTRPNSPLPDPVPQANPDLGVTRTVNLVELPPLLGSVDSSQIESAIPQLSPECRKWLRVSVLFWTNWKSDVSRNGCPAAWWDGANDGMAAGPFGYCDPIEGSVCCYLESTGYCGLMYLGFPISAAALFLFGMQY